LTNRLILWAERLNTLIAIYDNKSKSILLIDCSFGESCDHNSLITLTNIILQNLNKGWTDILTISTDYASYAIKCSQLIKERHNPNIDHINDILHLIHVAVVNGFECNKFRLKRELIISFQILLITRLEVTILVQRTV
jgi:hypothetical protein